MRVLIKPRPLQGELASITAKAAAHRQLICAALSDKPTFISPAPSGDDIAATADCLNRLGASLSAHEGGLLVRPLNQAADHPLLDCRESGTTLRFLLPLAAVLTKKAAFRGTGRLPIRPVAELISSMAEHGVHFHADSLPFSISGQLRGGVYRLPGHISSQYVSGLLCALPLANEDSEIHLSTPLQAPGYVQMTLDTLKSFAIKVRQKGNSFYVMGRQKYLSPGRITLEGDWSNAACFLASGALAGPVRLTGLSLTSLQPDKGILTLLTAFGAKVERQKDAIMVSRDRLNGQEIDVASTPDLVPILAVLGALAKGRTVLKNAACLRYKESDRLQSMAALLSCLGARVTEGKDALIIEGQEQLNGGEISEYGDHRLVMAAALAACACRHDVIIRGAEAINKSYPAFFADYRSLGGYAANI